MSLISRHPLTGLTPAPLLTVGRPVAQGGDRALAVLLLDGGVVQGHAMVWALNRQAQDGGRLIDILLAQRLVTPTALYAAPRC